MGAKERECNVAMRDRHDRIGVTRTGGLPTDERARAATECNAGVQGGIVEGESFTPCERAHTL